MEPDSQSIEEYSYDNKIFSINWTAIDLLIELISSTLGVSAFETSVSFVSDKEIQELNKQYRSKDRETDVLSFPLEEWPEKPSVESPFKNSLSDGIPRALGDIIISLSTALHNADKIGQRLDREVCFLLIHSVLHLCGYDHMQENEEKEMIEQQKLIMNKLSTISPCPWTSCAEVKS